MRKVDIDFAGYTLNLSVSRLKRGDVEFVKAFESWENLESKSITYNSEEILNKAISAARKVKSGEAKFERDTVLFYEHEYVHHMLSWMMQVLMKDNRLSVLDFGGGFGSRYFQHRDIFQKFENIDWCVLEQQMIINAAKKEFTTNNLKFLHTIEEADELVKPNFLLLSSVLQYIKNPYKLLKNLLQKQYPYILVDRTMARYGQKDELYIQNVPPSIYDAKYPVWFLDADKIEKLFANYGYRRIERMDPHPGSTFGPKDKSSPYLSIYFELA